MATEFLVILRESFVSGHFERSEESHPAQGKLRKRRISSLRQLTRRGVVYLSLRGALAVARRSRSKLGHEDSSFHSEQAPQSQRWA